MRQPSTETVDKAVWTDGNVSDGAARLDSVLVALVERKARALHADQQRRRRRRFRLRDHPLLLLLRDVHHHDSVTSIVSPGAPHTTPAQFWCEDELSGNAALRLHAHQRDLSSPEELEMERRRRKRRRRRRIDRELRAAKRHRTLLVSAIDEQAKVIHVLDPDELPRRARYTIMVTAALLLFLCLLLVGVTLRMAPLIDDIGKSNHILCTGWILYVQDGV